MGDDPVTSAIRLALIFKMSPFEAMMQPTRIVAAVLNRTAAIFDELASEES